VAAGFLIRYLSSVRLTFGVAYWCFLCEATIGKPAPSHLPQKIPIFTPQLKTMQQLPIGEQNFAKIRQSNMLYVDKTEQIYRLLQGSSYNFLSRPRRFGKSLTLSTIQSIFKAEKELFKGLWIEERWDWSVQTPVIHLSFNRLDYHKLGLEQALVQFLDEQAAAAGLQLGGQSAKEKLRELILALAAQQAPIVLLVDEYDKPLIDYLDKSELSQAKANRSTLKNFYGGFKDNDTRAALRFFLITGVSKFSQVSLFSDLNYLSDISLNSKYNTLVGYTQEELLQNFEDYLQLLQHKMGNVDRPALLERIRRWYNGYSWDGTERVYNPFSILLLFENLSFGDFWFKSGTPTFLINLLKEQELYVVDDLRVSGILFDSYDLENMDAVVQTPTHVYIIEFKLNLDAKVALAQIVEKQYAEKYRLSQKKIIGLGISFDTIKKAVKDWVSKEV